MSQLALVTGASSGIGLEIARILVSRGFDIVGVGASVKVDQLPSQIPGATVHPVRADLRTHEGVDQVWSAVEALDPPPLGVAALNAGRSLGGSFLDTDIEDELELIALNITSQVLAKRVAPADGRRAFRPHPDHVVVVGPDADPYESIYGPIRAFMLSFAEGLRGEMKEFGVPVTALLPGATATDLHHTAGMDNTIFGSNDWKNDPALVARQGVDALFANKDHVVGGDRKTQRAALMNRVLPDPVKAHRFAKSSRPSAQQNG